MRLEATVWTMATVYYLGLGVLYLSLSHDPVGTTFLLFAAAFGGLVGGWLWHWNRTNPERAEDVADAHADAEAGVVGVYPSASLRPLGVAVGMCGLVLGLVLGLWMTLIGAGIMASQVALLVRDADR